MKALEYVDKYKTQLKPHFTVFCMRKVFKLQIKNAEVSEKIVASCIGGTK
jgi:hypothetical protein